MAAPDGSATPAALHRGYLRHAAFDVTLVAGTVFTIGRDASASDLVLPFPAATVLVGKDSAAAAVWVVFDDDVDASAVTDPDPAGAGDSDNEMVEIDESKQTNPLSIDRHSNTVKLVSSAGQDVQVIVLG